MKLILGGCLEIMKTLPDQSIDLCLTDPPYGITKSAWDIVPPKEIFNEILRVSKNQIFFGGHFFDLPRKDGWIVWNKMPFLKTTNQCELLWTSFLKKNKVVDFLYAGNCVGSKKPNYNRPKVYFTSEKPIEFILEILNNFCVDFKSIIDPFMGTGVIGQASLLTGKTFVGIEKNKTHFDLANDRFNKP